ncbi:N(6)-hydroxylysine O-acetyltransferase [Cedecea neteri]|uniref:N(6)-hydroxylysine O-acetyltransferase n=1 Tax=Cedecea neteri TaxID=158822 RepID=A0A2X3INQ5_9ENTR|nr:N(6)-hydroxylysine O-acetyltransferase [Cedecea neteri]
MAGRAAGAGAIRFAKSDIVHRATFWQLPLWLSAPANQASGEMVFDAEREIYFPLRPARPTGKFIAATIRAFAKR